MHVIKNVENAPKPVGPYSVAIKSNGLLFLSGQIALDPKTNTLVSGGAAEQTEQVLKNIEAVLKACGSSLDKIVMTSIFLTNIQEFKLVNEIYAKYVNSENPPARQTLGVKELPLGAVVEISVIAGE